MDIFTTQLTRLVPVPIKPASLKVKALLKEAGAGKLKEDLDHLENHDYYFTSDEDKQQGKQENKKQKSNQQEASAQESQPQEDVLLSEQAELTDATYSKQGKALDVTLDEKAIKNKEDNKAEKVKHLDLYA